MHHLMHIVIGILIAIVLWKLIRMTFKSILFFIILGAIAFFLFPKALVLVGGLGFLVVGFLVTLIVLGIGGFFFLGNDD
ncbi:hypothetical protein LJK88_40915 [Paenibacillus sp. P26]|nr:hypothetical protein LJK88_40915 [Paenibacillus sp. P26]UUZ92822.1 hypothetical protein LJK87_47400 [Paenibacillus sp. P25]